MKDTCFTSKINKNSITKAFSRAANTYENAAVLQKEVGSRLLERLDFIKMDPSLLLDLGGGTGFFMSPLSAKYPNTLILNLDIASGMLTWSQKNKPKHLNHLLLCADAEYIPLAKESVDIVFSNCTLQWTVEPKLTFQEVFRILKPEGLFIFSTFGPDTLKELKESFRKTDEKIHVNSFLDMHDIGDLLLKTAFSDPVMDMEKLTLHYKEVHALLRDLKSTGSNTVINRTKFLSSKNNFLKMLHHYEDYREPSGWLPATYEILYGIAWKGNTFESNANLSENIVHIPISDIQRKS